MNLNELSEAEKLRIIQWHAIVCLDGTRSEGQSWKADLASFLNVQQSALTKVFEPGYRFTRKSKIREGLAGLGRNDIARILGVKTLNDGAYLSETDSLENEVDDVAHYAYLAHKSSLALSANGQRHADEYRYRLWRQQMRWRGTARPCQTVFAGEPNTQFGNVPLPEIERQSIDEVFRLLTEDCERNQGAPATIVHATPYSGISYLLYRLLPGQPEARTFYPTGFLHLHLDGLDRLEAAGRHVSIEIFGEAAADDMDALRKGWASIVAKELVESGRLLIVHGASSAFDDQSSRATNFIQGVVDEVAARTSAGGGSQRRCSRVLLVTWDPSHFRGLNKRKARFAEFSPEMPDGELAFEYFQDCVEHYRLLRTRDSTTFQKPGNNAIKRVQHHYLDDGDKDFTPLPASIRFRAFCVTDMESSSPFDPTQGVWDRVDDELRPKVPEISYALGDVQTYVRSLKPGDRKREESGLDLGGKELLSMRLASTSLFYLSTNMIAEIGRRLKLNISADDLPGVIYQSAGQMLVQNKDRTKIIMPLLARALIQDDWIRFSPNERTRVHKVIAEILLEIVGRNEPSEMAIELPYSPPRNNRQILFALEVIRHLSRAVRTSDIEDRQSLSEQACRVYDDFLEHGMFFPVDAYLKPARPFGYLSRCFGLDSLKYEALCLLSQDGRGLKPPEWLCRDAKARFYREIAITLLHLLRPSEAERFFELAANQTNPESKERAYILSHWITAELEQDSHLGKALEKLEECRSIEATLSLDTSDRLSVAARNDAREAAIHFAQGATEAAEPTMALLAGSGIVTFTGERAILFIDTHLPKFPDMIDLDQANEILVVLEQARNDALRQGYEHERIRLDIRRAQLYRLFSIPEAGVPVLEGVGTELHQFGGSEIAFREFQISSAQILSAVGRPGYAFSAYALPCFLALDRKDVPVRRHLVRNLCHQLLLQHTDEVLDDQTRNPFRIYIEQLDRQAVHPAYSFDLLPSVEEVQHTFNLFNSPDTRADFLRHFS